MKLWSDSFKDGGYIPGEFAFCVIDPKNHVVLSRNKNPHLAWSDVPEAAQSLVLICHDMDAPSCAENVNQVDKTVAADLPRLDFFHWTLVDVPVTETVIRAGQYSEGVTVHGKGGPEVQDGRGVRHGINDYTGWFAEDAVMAGVYFGYDGPCPPWNDSVVHRYLFTLYALNIARTPVEGEFSGQQVRAAIKGHILEEAKITGIYTLNPFLAQPSYGKAEA